MQIRQWNLNKDYIVLTSWCKKHNWDLPMPKESLPKLGIIIEDNKPLCAAGLFIDRYSNFGFMYGIFSCPEVSKIKLFKAMKLLVNGIKREALKNKIKLIYTITGEDSLDKLYTKHLNMICCGTNVKSYIINLDKNKYKNLDWIKENDNNIK